MVRASAISNCMVHERLRGVPVLDMRSVSGPGHATGWRLQTPVGYGLLQNAPGTVGAATAAGGHLELVTQCIHGAGTLPGRFVDVAIGDGIADADVHVDSSPVDISGQKVNANENGSYYSY
jgi:hypothetical protein